MFSELVKLNPMFSGSIGQCKLQWPFVRFYSFLPYDLQDVEKFNTSDFYGLNPAPLKSVEVWPLNCTGAGTNLMEVKLWQNYLILLHFSQLYKHAVGRRTIILFRFSLLGDLHWCLSGVEQGRNQNSFKYKKFRSRFWPC